MLEPIKLCWTQGFIQRCTEKHRSTYCDRVLKRADLYENAREHAIAMLEALVAYASVNGSYSGPDANDVANLLASVCTDDDLRLISAEESEAKDRQITVLRNAISTIEGILKGDSDDQHGAISDYLGDCRKFDSDFGDAMR